MMIPGRLIKKAGTTLIWLLAGYGARQVADPWLDAVAERIPFVHDDAPRALPALQHVSSSVPFATHYPSASGSSLSSYNASSALPVPLPVPLAVPPSIPFSVPSFLETLQAPDHLKGPSARQVIPAHQQDITALLAEARYVP